MTPRSSESDGGLRLRGRGSVGKAAARDAAAIDESAVEAEGVARMDAPDVRADGAASAFGIGGVGEVCAAAWVLRDGLVGLVGREFDGGAVSPAADEFGGEFFFAVAE